MWLLPRTHFSSSSSSSSSSSGSVCHALGIFSFLLFAVALFATPSAASRGDRLPEFKDCVQVQLSPPQSPPDLLTIYPSSSLPAYSIFSHLYLHLMLISIRFFYSFLLLALVITFHISNFSCRAAMRGTVFMRGLHSLYTSASSFGIAPPNAIMHVSDPSQLRELQMASQLSNSTESGHSNDFGASRSPLAYSSQS